MKRRASGFIMGEMFRRWRSEQKEYVSPITGKVVKKTKPFVRLSKFARKMVREQTRTLIREERLNRLRDVKLQKDTARPKLK